MRRGVVRLDLLRLGEAKSGEDILGKAMLGYVC
jgi:hypothetical protein